MSCCSTIWFARGRVLIEVGGAEVFCCEGSKPEQAIQEVMKALNRLLLPEMGDSPPLFVGQVPDLLQAHLNCGRNGATSGSLADHICVV